MEEPQVDNCPHCDARAKELEEAEEKGLAILVALMPLMTITFLGNLGLF